VIALVKEALDTSGIKPSELDCICFTKVLYGSSFAPVSHWFGVCKQLRKEGQRYCTRALVQFRTGLAGPAGRPPVRDDQGRCRGQAHSL
jgi:hypothetical protein